MANPKGLSVVPAAGFPTVGESPSGVDPAGEPSNGAIESSPAPANVPNGPHFLESEWVMWSTGRRTRTPVRVSRATGYGFLSNTPEIPHTYIATFHFGA